MNDKTKKFLKTLGPGIMFAGTCIGGSHLVQSTRAGADYGFQLLILILLANLVKYPFFEFASRYTNATGKNILQGYRELGKFPIIIYGFITLISMFIVTGAIFMITAGLMANLFHSDAGIWVWTLGLASIVLILLLMGEFSVLDQALKVIGVVLVISVLGATFFVLKNGTPATVEGFREVSPYNLAGLTFIVPLMGWMPMGVDMSAWHSIWTQERIKQTNYHPTLKETLLDFKIGYFITVVLAICFLTLGAYVFHGSGQAISNSGIAFANQLVTMFTANIGQWSYIIIACAIFSTMFGTSLTLVDGYAKGMTQTTNLLFENNKINVKIWTVLTIVGGLIIVWFSTNTNPSTGNKYFNFKALIDTATTLSFLIAPFAAYLNHKLIFNKKFPSSHVPPRWLKLLSYSGLLFLSLFTIIFIGNYFKIF